MARRRQNDFCRTSKILLCVFNSIFLVCGIILIVMGLITHFSEPGQFDLPDTISSINLTYGFSVTITTLGVITSLISFSGFGGAYRESRCLLGMYIGFLVTLILTEVAIGMCIRVFTVQFLESVMRVATAAAYESYQFNDTQADGDADFTHLLHNFQIQHQCCGVQNYEDYFNSNYFNASASAPLGNSQKCNVPKSCCMLSENSTDTNLIPRNYTECCLTWPPKTIHPAGCYGTVIEAGFGKWSFCLAATVFSIGLFEITVLMMALGLVCTIRDA